MLRVGREVVPTKVNEMNRVLVAMAAAGVVLSSPCGAQTYPNKPVRVIVPFAAGGGSDGVARVLARKLSERLGQPFIVENRTGAGGSIGADAVAKAAPDGYTLLLGSSSEVVLFPALNPNAPYNPSSSFVPIAQVAVSPFVLVVAESVPVKSLPELIALARRQPDRLAYGSAGTGSTTHLAMELFAAMAGVKITHIPYKGSAPVVADLLSGNLQLALSTVPPVLPHARSGKLRLLAISSGERSSALPDLPTIAESGVKGYRSGLWTGLFAPAATPPEVIARLAVETSAALVAPDVRDALMKQGADPAPAAGGELAATIRADFARWRNLIRDAGIKAGD